MLSAKLFAELAGAILVVIGLNHVHVVLPSGTLGRFASRIAIGPSYWQIFVLLISTVFASAYFLVFRFIVAERAQNHIAGLAGFFLIAAAALTWFGGTHAVRSQSLPRHAQIVAPLVAILSFVVGTVLTSANLAWALLKK